MKINMHERPADPQTVTLRAKPLSIWVTRHVQLVIEKGDTLESVARAVVKHTDLGTSRARNLVGFWFALGERAKSPSPAQKWTKAELDSSPTRRYLDR